MKIEELLYKYRFQASTFLIGVILFCFGIATTFSKTEENVLVVEENESTSEGTTNIKIVVEISGAVLNPGVYEMSTNSRIDDLIKKSGGFSNENTEWVAKFINRASVLKDGQKIYIPAHGEQSPLSNANNFDGSNPSSGEVLSGNANVININTASKDSLESLSGIGPAYAQKIVDQRPYSDISELKSKSVISDSLFEKIKNSISVY